MDFFDPQKQKRHAIRLAVGYALIGVMLVLATVILLYYSYGFGLDKEGRVIQNGFVFASSQPEGAAVFINGKKYKDETNTRLNLPSGQYVMRFARDGYRDWKRAISVKGAGLERFDYPLLFPKKLITTEIKKYSTAPNLITQSSDYRWLLLAASEQNTFDLYDLNAKEPAAKSLTISGDILAAGSTTRTWELIEWAKDSRHVLLKRLFDKQGQAGTEYILFDREVPELSQNLSVLFGFSPSVIELRDRDQGRFYLFDQGSGQVFTATLKAPTPQPYLTDVLAFSSEKDFVAFVTAKDASDGKVQVRIKQDNDPSLLIRTIPVGGPYLLDMGVYERKLYLAAGATIENRVLIFKDPIASVQRAPQDALAPIQILKVSAPTHLSFSATKRIAIVENSNNFAAYDAETDREYSYQIPAVMDAPQQRAAWLDSYHLGYVGSGQAIVFDFDGSNTQQLSAATPHSIFAFDRKRQYMYTLNDQNQLTSTALLTAQDQ